MSLTAMYLFAGYSKSSNEDINMNFSEAGEIESAARLFDIAKQFHKEYSFEGVELPGIFEYEVVEEFGEFIASSNLYSNDHPNSYYVKLMIVFTNSWLFRNNAMPPLDTKSI
ncbi:hypothetical protein [Rosenbergiella collisarenosi]|uniref:hypothetical protein n=1 Tax=Rosenbergiella collisarenosi TaxID=1544695 RepID=UPI001F4F0263|nr:hypothetical protein [Rosenbergiella collisarenosi]